MKKWALLWCLIWCAGSAWCNMAYWGPRDGQVAGRNTSGKIRVLHEVITVDMRSMPAGKTRVFADYLIQSKEGPGWMSFLFVASAANPVNPEIILDGVVQKIQSSDSALNGKNGYRNTLPGDSLRQIIGLQLGTDVYHNQQIMDRLYEFTVFITPGRHKLKIGYELIPTAHDNGDLRYYDFAYFLGNDQTRPLYDSIELFVMYPTDVNWSSNVPCRAENHILHCHDLAGFRQSHIWISLYKPVAEKISKTRILLERANVALWITTALLTLYFLRRRLSKGKKTGAFYLWVIPVSLITGILWFVFQMAFYNHFLNKYPGWLNGYFGKGYHFLGIPVIALIAAVIWLLLVFFYQLWFLGKAKNKTP